MQHLIGNRVLQVILVRLAPQDRDAVLEVRKLDVGDHAPLESRNEPGFDARDLAGRAVAGEYDLPSTFVQRIEGVKELLLCCFFALEEMNVVDEQQVELAEPATEVVSRSSLDRHHVFIRELLGTKIRGSECRSSRQDGMRNRLHQVRLPDAGSAVDKQRVEITTG